MLDPDVRRVLDGTSIAHLATVLPDGSPHTVPLWIGTHGDRIVFLTGPDSRKARNLRRDPRMALSIAPADNPFQPVVIRGRVVEWLDGDAAWEIIDQLATQVHRRALLPRTRACRGRDRARTTNRRCPLTTSPRAPQNRDRPGWLPRHTDRPHPFPPTYFPERTVVPAPGPRSAGR